MKRGKREEVVLTRYYVSSLLYICFSLLFHCFLTSLDIQMYNNEID